MFLALDKDKNGTLSKQELKEYCEGTLTEIFIERGKDLTGVVLGCSFLFNILIIIL